MFYLKSGKIKEIDQNERKILRKLVVLLKNVKEGFRYKKNDDLHKNEESENIFRYNTKKRSQNHPPYNKVQQQPENKFENTFLKVRPATTGSKEQRTMKYMEITEEINRTEDVSNSYSAECKRQISPITSVNVHVTTRLRI